MKKTVFAVALLIGISFSALTYANLQDQPAKTTTQTETAKQSDTKKTDASCTEKNKADTTANKECHKNCQKPCCKKETK
jgi:hypothetical protein